MRKINWPFVGRALVRFVTYAALLAFCLASWLAIISIF